MKEMKKMKNKKEMIYEVLDYRESDNGPEFKVKWNNADIEWLPENKVYETPMFHLPGEKPVGPMTQVLKQRKSETPNKLIPLLRRFLALPERFFTITFDYSKEETLEYLLNEGTLNLSGNNAITELQEYLKEYKQFKKKEGTN